MKLCSLAYSTLQVCSLSHSVLTDSLDILWTVANQAPLPMDFSRQNTGVGCHSEVTSCVQLIATPWTVAQAPPSMGFSRQEYWSGLPFPSPGELPNPGTESGSPAL